MRLFVAVRPPDEIIEEIAALARPNVDGVRWTAPDQWHVTLRFLGEVDDERATQHALRAAPLLRCVATIGPRARTFGRGVVQLPVRGIDALATEVSDATRHLGAASSSRPFRGHLTLARTKGRRVSTELLVLDRSWPVCEIELVRSRLGRGGARYETLETFPLRSL